MSAAPLPSWIPSCEARRATRFSDGARESKHELIRQCTYSEVNLTPFFAASPAWKITEALGCMPAFDSDRGGVWRDHWICLGATTRADFHADALVQVDGSDWKVVDLGGAAPACAPIKEAESALRAITGIDRLDITGEIDDGEGSLTDQRNGDPTVRHPYRVMCRYESNLASYHVFLTYADGRYVLDPGDMSGTGVATPWFVHGKPVTSAE